MQFQFAYLASIFPSIATAGLINLRLAAIVIVLAIIGGTGLTILRSYKIQPINIIIAALISFVRGTPLLIQIFLCFYVLPAIGVDLSAEVAGVTAIALNSSIFITEIMRGVLGTLDPGQIQAATALALSRKAIWLRVILPQLLRRSLPALINEATVIVKGTALLSVITVVDVLRTAQQIASTSYRPFETLVAAALIFLVINVVIGTFGRVAEMKLSVGRT